MFCPVLVMRSGLQCHRNYIKTKPLLLKPLPSVFYSMLSVTFQGLVFLSAAYSQMIASVWAWGRILSWLFKQKTLLKTDWQTPQNQELIQPPGCWVCLGWPLNEIARRKTLLSVPLPLRCQSLASVCPQCSHNPTSSLPTVLPPTCSLAKLQPPGPLLIYRLTC